MSCLKNLEKYSGLGKWVSLAQFEKTKYKVVFIHLFIYLFIHLFICLFINLFMYSFIQLFSYLSFYILENTLVTKILHNSQNVCVCYRHKQVKGIGRTSPKGVCF